MRPIHADGVRFRCRKVAAAPRRSSFAIMCAALPPVASPTPTRSTKRTARRFILGCLTTQRFSGGAQRRPLQARVRRRALPCLAHLARPKIKLEHTPILFTRSRIVRMYSELEFVCCQPPESLEVPMAVFVQRRNATDLSKQGLLDIDGFCGLSRAEHNDRRSVAVTVVSDSERVAIGGPQALHVTVELEQRGHPTALDILEEQAMRRPGVGSRYSIDQRPVGSFELSAPG